MIIINYKEDYLHRNVFLCGYTAHLPLCNWSLARSVQIAVCKYIMCMYGRHNDQNADNMWYNIYQSLTCKSTKVSL